MQTCATLAAKHAALSAGIGLGVIPAAGWGSLDGAAVGMLLAGLGFAIVSARRLPNCQLPPVGGDAAAHGGDPAGGRRMARLRLRMDGLLTGMLSDDADRLAPADASSRRMIRPVPAEERRFEAPAAWRGSYVDALPGRRGAAFHPYPEILTGASGGSSWPWDRDDPRTLTSGDPAPRTGDTAASAEAGTTRADQDFWGPRGPAEDDDGASRSGRRPDGQARHKPQHDRHAKPRHAARPMSIGATLTRRLTSTKLTGRSAAHAG